VSTETSKMTWTVRKMAKMVTLVQY